MGDDNVVKPEFGKMSLGIKNPGFDYCRHSYVDVCKETREVICRKCGISLDPIEVIYRYAWNEESFKWSKNYLDILEDKISKLIFKEKRIKARIRRSRKNGIMKWAIYTRKK